MAAREFKTVIGKTTKAPSNEGSSAGSCLVVISGANLGKVFRIEQSLLLIGRSNDCQIVCEDPLTSRKHAQVSLELNNVVVRDLGSTNGTYVNFQRTAEHILEDGDKISIGENIFKFLSKDTVETAFHDEVYKLASLDGLTQIYNRKQFNELLSKEFSKAKRGDIPLALCMFDIDHFKSINDTYGHQAGDFILRTLTETISGMIRQEDIFARYGGEEFILLLPGQDAHNAHAVAEKIRKGIADKEFIHEDRTIDTTISIGISQFSDQMQNPEEFVKHADEKLYQAKEGGRNQTCL